MKILIFGQNGQVAWESQRACSVIGEVVALGSKDVSFLHLASIREAIQSIKPTHIINAAAYTAVDKAETEEHLANQINGEAVGTIAEEAKSIGAKLIHYSTDYVFDGTKDSPYIESDEVCPMNAYGRSKALGEKYIQQVECEHLILRVSWVYGNRGNNFYKTMIRLFQEREKLNIVADQIGAPTWSRDIASATAILLRLAENKSGIYHMTPRDSRVSWYDFSKQIFSEVKEYGGSLNLTTKSICSILSSEYPVPAKRPMNSCMDSEKLMNDFGVALPSWDISLRHVILDRFEGAT
ncbi:dTDP-4-dehydrorhamnose reductase [Bdellovibrio sp. HCB274]|uniref:dTDP-4-dehydrorhamnose reductase n=1 Tax=Bdellovibrio sp. HCB274 TaxID=3394361 RepID=UPI0039B56FA8